MVELSGEAKAFVYVSLKDGAWISINFLWPGVFSYWAS